MIRTQIQLSEEQADSLKSLAKAEGVSMAELIRRSVDQYLQAKQQPDLAELRRQAVNIVGKYASGIGDVSENHDRYLAEIYAKAEL